jgi:hypothetical protein
MNRNLIPLGLALALTSSALGGARIIITEIMYNPASPENKGETEWVEIANVGDATIEITDWRLDDEDKDDWGSFSAVIGPGGVAVLINAGACSEEAFRAAWDVSAETSGGESRVPVPPLNYQVIPVKWGSLGNRPTAQNEILQLLDKTGNVISEVNYQEGGDWPTLVQPGGPSIYLTTLTAEKLNDGKLWRKSETGASGSNTRECRAAGPFVRGDVGSPGFLPGPSVETGSSAKGSEPPSPTAVKTGDNTNTIDY